MNIIVIPMYGIGDVLMSTPALRILKESIPTVTITYLSMFRSTHDVLINNPYVDNNTFFPFLEKGRLESLKFISRLRKQFDCSINFYPSNRRDYNLLSFMIGAPMRIGHKYHHKDITELNFLKNRLVMEDYRLHNVEENIRLLSFLNINVKNIPPMEIFLTDDELRLGEKNIRNSAGGKKIGIHAGTSTFKGHAGKRWPAENFIDLIRNLPDYDFYLFGGPDDIEVNECIYSSINEPNKVFLLRNLPIREVASCIKYLDLFVSNDSGLMHLAAAAGTPVVALFGPTNPARLRPWQVKHEIVRAHSECEPCFNYSPKPLHCCRGNGYHCIRDIKAEMVAASIYRVLGMPG